MQITMSSANVLALFGTMLVLAFLPSVSVFTVTARAASFGFTHGLLTTVGIVAADLALIVVAIYGLSFLVELLGAAFIYIKYLGGTYLIWLGIRLGRAKPEPLAAKGTTESSLKSSFMLGFLITLADQKAVLFYLGFLPAFLDLTLVTFADTVIIVLAATFAITVAKLSYVYLANVAGSSLKSTKIVGVINRLAALIMIVVGISLFVSF